MFGGRAGESLNAGEDGGTSARSLLGLTDWAGDQSLRAPAGELGVLRNRGGSGTPNMVPRRRCGDTVNGARVPSPPLAETETHDVNSITRGRGESDTSPREVTAN